MAYIGAGCGKPLSAAAFEVYFDLLGDLPLPVLEVAAKRVVLEHRWANFPSVAELREAAAETTRGEVKELSSAEAWEMAWRAAGRIDLEITGSLQRACEGLPVVVVEAMTAFGIASLCHGDDPVSVMRGQFVKIFDQLAARDRRQALLPAVVREQVRQIGLAQDTHKLPDRVKDGMMRIGVEGGK